MNSPLEAYQLEIPHMQCIYCDYQGEMANTWGWKNMGVCPSCIMAFEEDDAPEELAITLGNKDRGRVCLNQTCPRYGQLTSWNFCQFCEHATVPV